MILSVWSEMQAESHLLSRTPPPHLPPIRTPPFVFHSTSLPCTWFTTHYPLYDITFSNTSAAWPLLLAARVSVCPAPTFSPPAAQPYKALLLFGVVCKK